MVLHVLRALFVLLMAGVGWFFVAHSAQPFGDSTWLALTITLVIAVFFVCVDILAPRKKLVVFSGTFLGLIVGVVTAWGLSFAVSLMVDQWAPITDKLKQAAFKDFVNILVGIICCYLAISFVLQTKDDFRFIIPYVEFSKQIRGARPLIVDSSVLIDGRVVALLEAGAIDTRMIVPRFILAELQLVADQSDRLKRSRGRRGLEVLNKMQTAPKADVVLYEWHAHGVEPQTNDERLLSLTKELGGRLLTNDYNLSRVALVRGVDVLNINDIAAALRPVALPGEKLSIRLVKPGEEPTQGVGYLDDGTMVVVEHGRAHLHQEVQIVVTNSLQTPTGRMLFGRLDEDAAHGPMKSQAGAAG
jgi:uncharacterized protein YacL